MEKILPPSCCLFSDFLPRSLPLIWTWSPNHLFPLSDLPSALCVPRIEILGLDYAREREYPWSFQTDPSQDDTILPISWMRILGCRGRFFHLRNTFPNNAFQGSKIRSGHIRLSWKNAPTHRKLWNCHDLLHHSSASLRSPSQTHFSWCSIINDGLIALRSIKTLHLGRVGSMIGWHTIIHPDQERCAEDTSINDDCMINDWWLVDCCGCCCCCWLRCWIVIYYILLLLQLILDTPHHNKQQSTQQQQQQ